MRTKIIGANSYIARNMIVINKLKGYSELSLYDYALKHIDGVETYYTLNVLKQWEMDTAVQNCDLIYFFVGKTGTIQGFDNADEFIDINEKALLCLLNACRKNNPQAKIIFPSTRLIYEGAEHQLKEEDMKAFKTPYAIQKYACEQYLSMYREMYGIDYCILRIGVPYGSLVQPVSSYGTLDFFIKQAKEAGSISIFGDGAQKRTFTNISDLCHILWQAGLSEQCKNTVYNVPGESLSIAEIAEIVAQKYHVQVQRTAWPESALKLESGSTVFDTTKIEALLGYQLSVTAEKWMEEQCE